MELAATLALVLFLVSGVTLTSRAFSARADEAYADLALEQVVLAQWTSSAANGSYVWGVGESNEDRDASLLAQLPTLRDLEVTQDSSSGLSVASVAVGQDGTLVVAVRLTDGRCRVKTAPAPSAGEPDGSVTMTYSGVACLAETLLPDGGSAAWG
jgi:hypothetical protein